MFGSYYFVNSNILEVSNHMEDVDDLSDLPANLKLAVYHLSRLYEICDEKEWVDGYYSSFVSETHEYIRQLVADGTIEFKSSDYYYIKDIHEHLLENAFYKKFRNK